LTVEDLRLFALDLPDAQRRPGECKGGHHGSPGRKSGERRSLHALPSLITVSL
jgi:hypothetical protein